MKEEPNISWWPDAYRHTEEENEHTRTSVYVNGNDGYKRQINRPQSSSKHEAIKALKLCHYRTPPREVAFLLEVIFKDYDTKEGHWLYIAQVWNPRAINRVISLMIKLHKRGDVTFRNPPAYFTFLIKKRKKRKTFTSNNDTRKQQKEDYERRSSETRGGDRS